MTEKPTYDELLARVKALEESKNLYRSLAENPPDLLYRTDQQGKIVFLSESVYNLSGYTMEEALGMNMARDITELKTAQEAQKKLIEELKEAMARIRTLDGMLPICSSCKKIRDDKGYWTRIEAYIYEHTDVQLSHGLCPDCAKKLYPFYAGDTGKGTQPNKGPVKEEER